MQFKYATLELSTLLAALGPAPALHRAKPHFVGPYIRGLFQRPQPQNPPSKMVGQG